MKYIRIQEIKEILTDKPVAHVSQYINKKDIFYKRNRNCSHSDVYLTICLDFGGH